MSLDRSDRRTVLKTAASGALALSTGGFVANSVAQDDYAGKLVFTYDDGVVEDYTQTYQEAHEPEGVPACSAVVAGRVGSSGTLSESQLQELHDAGWEIMSHTVRHRALTAFPVTRDISSGDRRVYVAANHHGTIPGDTLRIFDGSKSEVVTTAEFGDDGEPYITLEEPVSQSFAAEDTAERYTDDVIRSALRDSRAMLEEYGVSVSNIVMPYSAYGEQTQEFVSDHYTAVANAGNNNPGGVNGDPGLNPVDDFNLPHLSRRYFRKDRMTYDEIASFLDRVRDEDVLGIFGGHSWWNRRREDKLSPERIRDTIQMAKDRNIEIVTLQQALEDLGYVGPTPTTTETPTTTTDSPTTTETPTPTETPTTSTTTETTTTTGTPTTTTTETSTTTTATTSTTTETPTPTETPTTTATTTTSRNDGDNSNGNTGGFGGGNDGGADSTTTTETPTTTITTDAPTTDATEMPTTTSTTEMPMMTETSTETTTPVETPTSTETTLPTSTTRDAGESGVPIPGFNWLATFGAAGSLTAYALSQLNETDEER